MDGECGRTGSDVVITHHCVDIVNLTVDERIGVVVFGELSLRTAVEKVAATAQKQRGGGNKS